MDTFICKTIDDLHRCNLHKSANLNKYTLINEQDLDDYTNILSLDLSNIEKIEKILKKSGHYIYKKAVENVEEDVEEEDDEEENIEISNNKIRYKEDNVRYDASMAGLYNTQIKKIIQSYLTL